MTHSLFEHNLTWQDHLDRAGFGEENQETGRGRMSDMEGDMIGYGLMVLGIGIPAAVSIAKIGNNKHARHITPGNGEMRKLLATVARLEERSLQQAESIRGIHHQLESVISRLDKKR